MASEPYFTKIPEWATERAASGMAQAAYQHLAKRLNRERGDRIVDPSRARLAADLGLKKEDYVDPYLRELAVLGMVQPITAKGKRTRYFLPEWPPEGYDGPMSTVEADRWQRKDPAGYQAWRAAQRALVEAAEAPYKEKSRTRVARSVAKKAAAVAAPEVPVVTGTSDGGDPPVATGRYLPVVTGTYPPVATGSNQTRPDEGTSSGDGRRPGAGDRPLGFGGFAAPAQQHEPGKTVMPWREIGQLLSAIPAPLASLLEGMFPAGLPPEVNAAAARVLAEPRTVAEAQGRLARRWLRYEDDALSLSGRGIDQAVAVLYELLAPSYCEGNNVRCEDGYDLDRQDDCRLCTADKAAFRAAKAPPEEPFQSLGTAASVPEQRATEYALPRCAHCEVPMQTAKRRLCRECQDDADQYQDTESRR
jgi:hypothetical protein